MRIKNLVLLICLFSTISLKADNTPFSIVSTIPSSNDEATCNLPAPFNFHIEEIGSTWVKYAWSGSAAYKKRIRTYRASDNALLNTTIVPAGNASAIINGLTPGTEIYGVINAICDNGSNSTNEATSARGVTLIIDLLVELHQVPENNISTCTISGLGNCALYGNPMENSYFKIYLNANPNDFRFFAMRQTDGIHYKVVINEGNGSNQSQFDFKCNGSDPDTSCSGPQAIEVWGASSVLIGKISASLSQTSTLFYTPENGVSGYTIKNIIPNAERGALNRPAKDATLASTAPNPFSEALEVFLSQPNAQQITLQLFSLSGQKVLDQQFPGGQEQYSLSTAGLSTGFYLLRIEADGEVQTLKVIKSE